MNTFSWCGYEWITQQRWGQIHPEFTTQWYAPQCTWIDNQGNLNLAVFKHSKYFEELNVTSPIAIGLASCTEKFSYGTFELDAMMPEGRKTWPAFWMWSWESYPPEIDVFEAYTDIHESYFKFRLLRPFGFWNVQSNIHFRDSSGAKDMIGGRTHWLGFKNPKKYFINYKVEWYEDIIRFYYNKRVVRTITDKHILSQFKGTHMNVIINNAVQNDMDMNKVLTNVLTVKNFKYTPY